jgi:hypothetical protein
MSDSGSETSTDVRVDSEFEETAEVISEESGGVVTETRPIETDDAKATTDVQVPITGDSTEDEIDKPGWVPLAVGVLLVVAIAAIAIIFLLRTGSPQVQLGEAGERGVEDQADWKFKAKSIGGKHPTGKHPDPPKDDVKAIEELVRNWNDALILSPGQFSAATKKYFSPPAGNAISSSDFGLPKSANQVETTKRKARISIEADGAQRAVVDVSIVARGKSDEGDFRSESESTLWLERSGSKWTVIAFDVDQGPLPLNPKTDQSKGKNSSDASDSGGKKDEQKKNDAGKGGNK